MAQLLLPKYADMDYDRRKEVFSVAFYFNLIILLATVLCTQLFYFYYLDPEYRTGLAAFYLMLPGYFFWGSVIYFGAFVSATGKFSYNLVGSTLCFTLILFTDIILIPLYGIEGAAFANSVCYIVIYFVYLYILTKKFHFRLNDLLWPHKKAFLNVVKFITR
jgi:O-antigen/teichoic acid export membrane protein